MMEITEIKDLTKDNDHILAIFYNDRNIKIYQYLIKANFLGRSLIFNLKKSKKIVI